MIETVKIEIPVRRNTEGQVICMNEYGDRVCVLSQRGILFGANSYCLPTGEDLSEDGVALPGCPIVAALEEKA